VARSRPKNAERPLDRGHLYRGRPVTERVTPVNMGNEPHCDNGEGLASYQPLTHCDAMTRTLRVGNDAFRLDFGPHAGHNQAVNRFCGFAVRP